jgi:hypothetical protein
MNRANPIREPSAVRPRAFLVFVRIAWARPLTRRGSRGSRCCEPSAVRPRALPIWRFGPGRLRVTAHLKQIPGVLFSGGRSSNA